jgi:hypothetical protein
MKSVLCVAMATLAFACDRGVPATSAPAAPVTNAASAAPTLAATASAHAAATAKPGSHEDWCGEHQVPESQCTRCNPDLVPAFKATNDWCAEHGLPESQCLKCNPNLKIVRPPPGTP